MDNTTLNKIIRNKTIWATIKASEQEYQRVQKQIDILEESKKDISFRVQKLIQESEKIGEYLYHKEFQFFNREEK
jgi:hypothetical protein